MMTYNEIKEEYPNLKEIPIIEMEVTFDEDYFVKYDHLLLNFSQLVVISRSYKNENGNYKLILRPAGENPSAILIPGSPPIQLQEL